ncbi:MAG: hypothetical protein ABIK92_05785 [Pseudomonadota bacterium]
MRNNSIFQLIEKNAVWKIISVMLFFTLILSTIIMLDVIPRLKLNSNGLTLPDAIIGYNVEYARKWLTTTSSEGLRLYLHYFFILDSIYPLISAISFTLIISALFKRIVSPDSRIKGIIILPFAAAFCDYFENIGVFFMISSLPDFNPNVALITSIFSSFKWILGALVVLLILTGSILYLIKYLRSRICKT